MSELYRAGAALGLAASLAIATGVVAQEATAPVAQPQAGQVANAAPEAPVAQPDVAAQQAPATDEQKATALVSDGVSAKASGDQACPKVALEPGAETFPKREDDHKATLEALARDCANLGAETILKVGLVGEGQRDDKSGPSWFNAPIKLSVKDANGADVETRKIRLKVQLASGVLKTSFNHLEENVSLPPVDGGYAGWTVVVGFDPKASAAASEDKPVAAPAKKVRAAAVRRASRVARATTPPTPVPAPAQQAAAPAVDETGSHTNFSRLAAWSKDKQTQEAIEQQKARMAQAKAQQQARAGQPQQARPATQPTQQQRAAQQQTQRVGPQASIAPIQQPTLPTGTAPGTATR